MSQLKYLIHACLILLCGTVVFILIRIISTSTLDPVKEDDTIVIDHINTEQPSPSLTKGKMLFQQNCQTCHSLHKDLTGPALSGFTERGPWNQRKNIYSWINNPAAFMAKDAYTKNLKDAYGGVIMQSFPDLKLEEIDLIIEYLNSSSLNKTADVVAMY